MPKKFRSNRRTIKSSGANATMGSATVSLLSATTHVDTDAPSAGGHAGWGGYSRVLPNEAAATVVTDPSELKAPLEHRNKVLTKLVRVLGDSLDSTSDCIRRGREIEKDLHAGCIGKRDYKLAAVERILRIEKKGDQGSSRAAYGVGVLADDNIFGAKASVSALSGRRAAKLPLAAGEAAARKTAATLPAKLRRLDGDKRAKTSAGQNLGIAVGAGGGYRQGGGPTSAADDEARTRQKAVERLRLRLSLSTATAPSGAGGGSGSAREKRQRLHASNSEEEDHPAGSADVDEDEDEDDPRAFATAKAVEEALFFELAASDGGMQAYHRQLRAILFNLSAEAEDSTELREALLSGQLAAGTHDTASVQQPCI